MGLFNSGSTLSSVVQGLVGFINLLVAALAVLAIVIFFWGLVRYIYHSDDEHALAEGRQSILWSLIAIFVLFSIWGILALLNVAFFGGSAGTVGGTTGNLPPLY